jgi:hypothetical protein
MRSHGVRWLVAVLAWAAVAAVGWGQAADPWAARRARLDQRPKKIFAHYMVCYPIGMLGIAPGYQRTQAARLRHDSPDYERAFGGRGRGVPLLPDEVNGLTDEQSADLEIRRALRAGIDGFAFDVLPLPAPRAFAYMDAMFKVCEQKDYPFEITWCLDNAGDNPKVVDYLIKQHGTSPKLARRDGKVLFFGYQSVFQGLGPGVKQWQQRPEWQGKEVGTYPQFRCTPEGWKTYRLGFKALEDQVGVPMYFYFGLGALFHGTKPELAPKPDKPVTELDAATVLAEDFDCIGEFSNTNPERNDAIAKAVLAKGCEWGEPMMYQFEGLLWNTWQVRPGTDMMRERWQHARDNHATLIQVTTWNDYTEHTHLAPTTDTRYGWIDLTAYFVQWWKTGTPPKPDHDKLFLVYPKYPHELATYPFGSRARWRNPVDVLEVLTILTKPAKVRLPGRTEEWDAPAGLSWKQVPLQVGKVSAELVRNGKVELRVDSPEPVTDHPYREQHSTYCSSSEDLRHWRADFGDAVPPAPLQRGEYADNGKGLPNWFALYWFGKSILDWDAAGKCGADSDPKGTGKTLRQHWLDRTDPTRTVNYPAGYRWDFMSRTGRVISFNPDLDDQGTPVWHYLQKYGADFPLAHDGDYWPCERVGWRPGADQQAVNYGAPYHIPGLDGNSRVGEFTLRWTNEGEGAAKRQTFGFVMSTGRNALRVLGWQSPVAGKVSVAWEALGVAGLTHAWSAPVQVTLEHSRPRRELGAWTVVPKQGGQGVVEGIEVQPGDRLDLAATVAPNHNNHGTLTFGKLVVTLQELAAGAGK